MTPGRLQQLADEVRYAVQCAEYERRYGIGYVPVDSPPPPLPPSKPDHVRREEEWMDRLTLKLQRRPRVSGLTLAREHEQQGAP